MYKTTLIEVVKTFSKQEIKEFGLFIQSPFFNTNQSVVKLYGQIKNLYPEFEENQLEKKLLFEKALGKIKYNDNFMRMTIFRLQELTKEFLIHKNLNRNGLIKETFLLDELNSRALNNFMMKSINDLSKKIEKQDAKDAETYFVKFRLEFYKNDIKARDTKMITYKDALDKSLMVEQKNLNIFYFISSLKFFQYFLNQKNFVVNAEGNPDFINNILEYLKLNNEYLNVLTLKMYYLLVLLMTTNDDKYFFELRTLLFEDRNEISYIDKFSLIAVLRNYAQQKHNLGEIEFNNIQIDIVKFSIEKNILTTPEDNKYISEMRIMNIIWAGTQSNEFGWLEEFIKKFTNRIEPDKRQYVLAYCNAMIEFKKSNYDQALELLGKSGPIKNVFYKAAIKQLTLMIYYELQLLAPAADMLDAYRHFVRTDKLLPEIYITKCNSFINYYNRLLKINDDTGNNSFEISKLISELESTSFIWILKKARELQISKKSKLKQP